MYQHDIPSVTRYETTLKGCSCPAHVYRPHRRPCKHTAALLDAVGVVKEWEDAHPGVKLIEEWSAVI